MIAEFLNSFNPNGGIPINTSNTTIRGVPPFQVERLKKINIQHYI